MCWVSLPLYPAFGLNIICDHATPSFNPPEVFFYLGMIPKCLIQRASFGSIKPLRDCDRETRLIVLHAQSVIRATLHNLICNAVLAAHCANGDNRALDIERAEQFRDRSVHCF